MVKDVEGGFLGAEPWMGTRVAAGGGAELGAPRGEAAVVLATDGRAPRQLADAVAATAERLHADLPALNGQREGVGGTQGNNSEGVLTVARPSMAAKWSARVARTRPCWSAVAAIHRSFVGIGRPLRRSSAKMRP